jgi:acyl carrier protein
MRDVIQAVFLEVFTRETAGKEVPQITDDLLLLESGLDSIGFAILVVELEIRLGFDPFSTAADAYYPTTFGEFVNFYERNKP